jgi:LexA-binding, inner membrane-associated putative hydrolase
MHFEPHATLGWAIGNIGGGDRRLRNYCTLGAILPDIDTISFLFGAEAYGEYHHTFGHNVFLWAGFVAWVGWQCRSWRAAFLSFLSFGSHLLTDAQLSGWKLYLFWPFSGSGYLFPGAVGLDAPINYWLVYLSPIAVVLIAFLYKRTPIDIFSPKLDRLIIAFFLSKPLLCGVCRKASNQICDSCGQPVCIRHGSIQAKLRLLCSACVNRTVTR